MSDDKKEAPDMPERRTVESKFRERSRSTMATPHQRTGILAKECSEAVEDLRNRCDAIDTEYAEFAEATTSALLGLRAIVDTMQSAYEMRIASLESRVLVLESRLGSRIVN